MSVYEMVNAYSTFMNSGFRRSRALVTRIEDRNGNVIKQSSTLCEARHLGRNGLADDLHAPRRHGGVRRHVPGPVRLELWRKNNQIGAAKPVPPPTT
jgi:penicillin-binding protein 1A